MIFNENMSEEEIEDIFMLYAHSYRPAASEDYEMLE